MGPRKIQIVLIVGALVLFVLLFFAPKQTSALPEQANAMANTGLSQGNASLSMYVDIAEKSLKPELKRELDRLSAQNRNDSGVVFWDQLKRPDLASFYEERKALKDNNAESWLKAGNRYYYAVQFTKDKTEVPVLYQCAMRCFSNSLKHDSSNVDARIMLASCYVEGSPSPMEGISRLKAIEQTDSNNLKLQLAFAFFSMKSGQLDKAIVRFNKALAIDSTYIEAYLHLADAYEQGNEIPKTIRALEQYARRTPNMAERNEVNKYIQQLKSK